MKYLQIAVWSTGLILCAFSGTGHAVEKNLLIVTTNRIRSGSALLDQFAAEKRKRGFKVRVATEDDYGSEDITGQDRGLAIRSFLQTVSGEFTFLLLIGDPNPDYGDVPMITVWPRHMLPADNCMGFPMDCRSHITDYLYADLTGNWDLDGDGRYGETNDDEGPGGIDLQPELYVGRIPVYFGDLRELDQILSHTIDYMNQDPDDLAYRRRALLPAAMIFFKGEQLNGWEYPETTDGATTAEWIRHNILASQGIATTTLYEQEGYGASAYDSDRPLTNEELIDAWQQGYGMVFWFAHGSEQGIYRKVWLTDTDGDDKADPAEMTSSVLLASNDAPRLDNSQPGFVVAESCEVGSAKTPYNIADALLVEGAAVGMIAATNPTSASHTDYSDLANPIDESSAGADNIGVLFFQDLIRGVPAGKAFYDAKARLGSDHDMESLANRTMLNYYGDPTLTLADSTADIEEPDAGEPDAGTSDAEVDSPDAESPDGGQAQNPSRGGDCSTSGHQSSFPLLLLVVMMWLPCLHPRRMPRRQK